MALVGLVAALTPPARASDERDRFVSRARQVTFEGRRAGEGYFSSDGQQMVFMSERYPGNPFFQIYTLDLESGQSRLISPGVGRTTCPFFRPGTDELIFASTHLDPGAKDKAEAEYAGRGDGEAKRTRWDYDEYYDVFATDVRGRRMRRLTDALGYDAECAYSPDGQTIVFASNRHAYPLENLTTRHRELWDQSRSNLCDIYVMNADGTDQRRLTDWIGEDGGPFFTPDGEQIIWRHFDTNGYLADVYTMKPDGTDQRRLTDFHCMSWAPYMHPSGQYAAFTANRLGFQNFEVYLVDALGDKEPVRVTYTDGFDGLPVFLPDGKSLSWTSSRNTPGRGRAQIFLADWDHSAALDAIRAAPPRGTPEPPPQRAKPADSGWESSGPPRQQPGSKPAVSRDGLYAHVAHLAADRLEGRMTGTEGTRLAAEYIAARFKELGLEPLGDDGTYFQAFPFPAGAEMAPDKNSLGFTHDPHATQLEHMAVDKDFRPLAFTTNDSVHGLLTFAGYGLVVPGSTDAPVYDSYANLDLDGKIVLALDDVPQKLSPERRIEFSHYSSPRYKAMQAKQRGAKGFLLVVGPNTAGAGELLPLSRRSSDAGIPAGSLTIEAADRLIKPTGKTLDQWQTLLDSAEIPSGFDGSAGGAYVALTTYLERKEGHCRNVLGLLPPAGDGPICDEYVMVGAHYDHIGHGEAGGSLARAGEEGQIHNGADDNASGVATVLELAAELAAARRTDDSGRPQRGIIFACWSGEEIGVIGSTHFARHAPCPLGSIAAYLNFDMVGRMRDGKLILQGVGSSAQWPRLVEQAGILEPVNVSLQDDPYLPTDTTAFYPAGVPILGFFTDVHGDYNRPTDDTDTLNYAGMEKVARFARALLTDLATSMGRPAYAEVQRAVPKGGGGRRIYTGTIPDFAAPETPGMKISGVSAGGPAEKAGLKPGDVIIRFAGQEIRGLEDYDAVLRAVKPEETVEVVVVRDGQQVKLEITPTLRK